MAVANFSGAQRTVTTVPWLAPGTWYDIQDQSTISVPGTTLPAITIPAYTARVFSSVPDSVLLPVTEEAGPLPGDFALEQNYPNPFNPSTMIVYHLPQSGHVRLEVTDVLGRTVDTLVDGDQPAGPSTVAWNPAGLPSGVYFYTLIAGGRRETRRAVLVG